MLLHNCLACSTEASGFFPYQHLCNLMMRDQVFSASSDGTVRLWDITEGSLLKTFAVNSPIISLVRHLASMLPSNACRPVGFVLAWQSAQLPPCMSNLVA